MNYLQVKIVSKVLEERIKYLKDCEHINRFEDGESKESRMLLEEFIKEIQNKTMKLYREHSIEGDHWDW